MAELVSSVYFSKVSVYVAILLNPLIAMGEAAGLWRVADQQLGLWVNAASRQIEAVWVGR